MTDTEDVQVEFEVRIDGGKAGPFNHYRAVASVLKLGEFEVCRVVLPALVEEEAVNCVLGLARQLLERMTGGVHLLTLEKLNEVSEDKPS